MTATSAFSIRYEQISRGTRYRDLLVAGGPRRKDFEIDTLASLFLVRPPLFVWISTRILDIRCTSLHTSIYDYVYLVQK